MDDEQPISQEEIDDTRQEIEVRTRVGTFDYLNNPPKPLAPDEGEEDEENPGRAEGDHTVSSNPSNELILPSRPQEALELELPNGFIIKMASATYDVGQMADMAGNLLNWLKQEGHISNNGKSAPGVG